MHVCYRVVSFVLLSVLMIVTCSQPEPAAASEPETVPTDAFAFTIEAELPTTPDEVWAALTGDISDWWDHSMSGNPHRLFIEARPGGGFWEIFDDTGDGVRHAVVTYAQRNKMLRMEGPLGLAGHAILMVTTYELNALSNEMTRLRISVHASGEVHDGWPEIVQRTWQHFLFERFVPFLTEENLAD
jgi:uncharacterized protein YndB with AHSA1/START domain